jgi:PAS domain S-box-containing protein
MTTKDGGDLQLQIQYRLFEELRASEKRYRELVEHLREVIFECDGQGRLTFLNQAWSETLGYSTTESLTRPIVDFIHEEDRTKALAVLEGQPGNGFERPRPKELRFRTRTGEVVWFEISARRDEKGHNTGSLYDTTERKLAREELQKSYDQLEVRVQERTTALTKVNQDLQQEVRERKSVEAALHQAKEAAEAATNAKSEFLAKMSHELRTPMNAIIGFTRLVMRRCEEILPAKQYENLEKILVSAERLLALINDILDLSKVEARRIELHPARFTLEPLVDTCLRTIEPMVKTEQLRLVKEIEADLPPLFTDQDRLLQILINLLSNAVKFTEEGTITITARREDWSRLAIAVTDTGIGIPAEARERIFEEFHQVDRGSTRHYSGTGLGLSISRHFARLLGGDIDVQSTYGRGSTFTVTIPFIFESLEPKTQTEALVGTDEVGIESSTGKKTILVIDDDPNVIYLLRENLTEAGYHVIGAATAEEGRQKARDSTPFAITLDILMPQQDGWQLLHELKSDPVTRGIPVIVLSVVDNRKLAYRLGAFECLLKPVERELMIATLARIASSRGSDSRLQLE